MEFINKFKEKQQSLRKEDLSKEAIDKITLTDFSDKIFIAYNNTPLVQIEDNWTPKEILDKLEEMRQRYVDYNTQMNIPKKAS